MFWIDETSWAKQQRPIGFGYETRPFRCMPSAIVLHAAGNFRASLDATAATLYNDPCRSMHYLIGKRGEIMQMLPPGFAAWHLGLARRGFGNASSIAVACHHAPGESWPTAQRAALTWLVRRLMGQWRIPQEAIATARSVRLIPERAVEAFDWTPVEVAAWRAALTPASLLEAIEQDEPAPLLERAA